MDSNIVSEPEEVLRSTDKSLLTIVIPALNEAGSIRLVLDEISKALMDVDYSVVVVDGNSVDGTPEIAKRNGAIVIDQRGTGYGDALISGFYYARRELDPLVIAMIDADMSYNPKDIRVLMEPVLKDEADFVIGNRFGRMKKGAMTPLNRIGNRLLSWATRVSLKVDVADTQCGLRVFRADLLDDVDFTSEGMSFATEMLIEAKFSGARISEMPITYRPRIGKPKLSPLKDGFMIFGTILRLMRDTQPLLFFVSIGFFLGLIGFVLGLDVTLTWLRTGRVIRLSSVMLSVLLIFGAMQFFTIGLVADMIKRLRKSLKWSRKNG
jgi:glycosyltransferase involved in cell wall biosynthesis